jgi:hypothetical protein
VDLLISSLHCDKLAKLDHPVFVPVVGSDPYDEIREQSLMTAAECNLIDIKFLTELHLIFVIISVYISKEKKLVILQIRGLLIKVTY